MRTPDRFIPSALMNWLDRYTKNGSTNSNNRISKTHGETYIYNQQLMILLTGSSHRIEKAPSEDFTLPLVLILSYAFCNFLS